MSDEEIMRELKPEETKLTAEQGGGKMFQLTKEKSYLDNFYNVVSKIRADKFWVYYGLINDYCARYELEKDFRVANKSLQEQYDKTESKKIGFEKFMKDFEKRFCGIVKQWTLTKKSYAQENKLIEGTMKPVALGVRYSFQGTDMGNRLSILVPLRNVETYEKWLKENFSNYSQVVGEFNMAQVEVNDTKVLA